MRRPTRTLVIAAAIAVSCAGIAVAAETGILTRLFGGNEPLAWHIDQLRDPDGTRLTKDEFASVQNLTMVPPPNAGVGMVDESDMIPMVPLSKLDRSRVIADDPTVGRALAVPSPDDSAVCFRLEFPDGTIGGSNGPVGSGGNGSCGINFDSLGLQIGFKKWSMDASDPAHVAIHGLVADEVDRVELVYADGRSVDAALVDNVTFWTSTEAPFPTIIRTTSGSVTRSERTLWR
jgi:hypothetical protein